MASLARYAESYRAAVFDRKADECPANAWNMKWLAPLNFFVCLGTEHVEYAPSSRPDLQIDLEAQAVTLEAPSC
jgi:hypothetical protein